MSIAKVVIIHGSYGRPDGNWFQWLKQQVEDTGNVAVVPKFPTPDGQSLSTWTDAFREQVGTLTADTILIGHSLGAGFVLNLLEQSDVCIRAAFLIAGFLGELGLPDFDGINSTFVSKHFDWNRIKKHAQNTKVISGDNDPYVPLSKGRELAAQLDVPLQVVPGGGHLNLESGYTEFPLLLEQLRPFLAPARSMSP